MNLGVLHIRKSLIFLSLILSGCLSSYGQTYEVGIFLGGSNYQGDLAPDLVLGETHGAFGVQFRQNLSPYFAFNYSINYGKISGDDNNFSYLAQRNLNFHSSIVEGSFQVEFNFFKYAIGLKPKKFSPYLFTGLSVFTFDPRTTYNGNDVALRPLHTEGQGTYDGAPGLYPKNNFAIPIGAGFKIKLSRYFQMTIHGSYRTTFTDYLDDVSGTYADKEALSQQFGDLSVALSDRSGEKTGKYIGTKGRMRGNPQNNDWYIFAGFGITYIIKDPDCPRRY